MTARYLIGDVFDGLASLPDNSVDLVMSSPPFLALRSYLPADHPDKGKEIGSEATPADFLDTLLDVVEACDRVLAPHGSLVFELGDSYAGSGGAGGDYNPGGLRGGQNAFDGSARRARPEKGIPGVMSPGGTLGTKSVATKGAGWPLAKSLCGIPTLFAWSLAYGRNLLRPERTTPQWRIRNVVVWCRPNPPVGALGDKVRPATSYLTVACKSRNRYFDLDAVRERPKSGDAGSVLSESRETIGYRGSQSGGHENRERSQAYREQPHLVSHPAGAPPLDYWVIPTHGYEGSHYATFPPKLCVKPILAMSPQRVCRVCGEPSRRITGDTEEYAAFKAENEWASGGKTTSNLNRPDMDFSMQRVVTLGWTDCSHDDWRPGHVLDPFGGSGTVGAVATGHGRDCTMIDLDERNAELALERVGPMLLTVEHLAREGAA